ncbi:MAG: hypothetical protein GX640_07505, partial [Fibrobacter sp.]|nr:hypothetical protein [Fibrobacter sp.]
SVVSSLIFIFLIFRSVLSLELPKSPSFISSAPVHYDTGVVVIPLASYPKTDSLKFHAALIRDLSVSFGSALLDGAKSSSSASGPTILKEVTELNSSNEIRVEINNSTKSRYFVGICVSKLDSAGVSHYSPWRVYTDTTGTPLQISTVSDTSIKKFNARTFAIDSNLALITIQCGVYNPSSCSLSVSCNSETRRISSMSTFDSTKYVVAGNLKDAITKAKNKTGFKNLVIRDTTAKPVQFSLYMIFDRGSASEISYTCKRTGTSGRVLADDPPLTITTDYGFKNMVSTIHALGKIPASTPNPVYYTGPIDTHSK